MALSCDRAAPVVRCRSVAGTREVADIQNTAEQATTQTEEPRRRPFRHRYTAEERQRIVGSVFLHRADGWTTRFAVMLALSVIIATLGLLANSSAIVIGAMLIAPLMTPIQATSVALAMGWGKRLVVPLIMVLLGASGSVGLAWVLTEVIPSPSGALLSPEVLSRTAPDLRDLVIALAAGAAGAYATAREDISGSLPGVAVAVALVPPLAVIGITLNSGHNDLAGGALLLFTTNFIAILLAGMLVLFVTGFVPVPHFQRVRPRLAAGLLVVVVAMALVTVPLTSALSDAVSAANRQRDVTARVQEWLGEGTSLEIQAVELRDDVVEILLLGPDNPPPAGDLAARLAELLGDDVSVRLRWSFLDVRAVESGATPVAQETVQADAEAEEVSAAALLRAAADAWAAGTPRLVVTSAAVDGDVVYVSVSGPEPPDDLPALRQAVEEVLERSVQLDVGWTSTQLLDDTGAVPTPSGVDVAVLPGLDLFVYGTTTLAVGADQAITELAELVTATGVSPDSGRLLVVLGHTDDEGPADLNRQLSRQRAGIVADLLADSGVWPREQIAIIGVGPSQPLEPNDTPEGRDANFRFEVRIAP